MKGEGTEVTVVMEAIFVRFDVKIQRLFLVEKALLCRNLKFVSSFLEKICLFQRENKINYLFISKSNYV